MPPDTIDDPMALLHACHDKVRHFCDLLGRLTTHIQKEGCDEQAREAAAAIRRYFEVAAPLHHLDEDTDLYPALIQLDPGLADAAAELSGEHALLDALWTSVRAWLIQVQTGGVPRGSPPPDCLSHFALRYRQHADAEERMLYPHAARLSAATRHQLASAMVLRRRQP